jgi:hypothetical protein
MASKQSPKRKASLRISQHVTKVTFFEKAWYSTIPMTRGHLSKFYNLPELVQFPTRKINFRQDLTTTRLDKSETRQMT